MVLNAESRTQVFEDCKWGDGARYTLHAAVVMPTHVHLLLEPLVDPQHNLPWAVSDLLQGIKSSSAHFINRSKKRRGAVWQNESFDHAVRHEGEFFDFREYIRLNPYKAGLAKKGEAYPWLYIRS